MIRFSKYKGQKSETQSNQGGHKGICNHTNKSIQVTQICDAYGGCYIFERDQNTNHSINKTQVFDSLNIYQVEQRIGLLKP